MNKLILQMTLTMLGLSFAIAASGHPATERYIPIGYWATVAGQDTYIGEIRTIDVAAHTMRVEGTSGYKSVTMTEGTRIWLDRSGLKLTNLKGSYNDCRPGRQIEVKFRDGSESEAEWIKVRITAR